MEIPEFISNARDAMSVKRVFGEPYEKDGVTIITAAKVSGGGGGGSGGDTKGGQGSGGGFGMSASPVGAYVIKDGKVTWMPAVDVNRVILGGQLIAILMLLTVRGMMRRRMRRRWAEKMGERRGPGRRFGPRHA
ncbi:MAG: spore germination protein GerW family protein [Nitrolancea sp.]